MNQTENNNKSNDVPSTPRLKKREPAHGMGWRSEINTSIEAAVPAIDTKHKVR